MTIDTVSLAAELKAVRLLLAALLHRMETLPGGLKAANFAKADAFAQAENDATSAKLNGDTIGVAAKVPGFVRKLTEGVKPI